MAKPDRRRQRWDELAPWRAPLAALALGVALDAASAVRGVGAPAVDGTGPRAAAPAGPIDPLFDCYAANSAWGLTYSGKVIDRGGQVWSYRARGKTLPASADEAGKRYFDAAELGAKFLEPLAAGSVDGKTLAEHAAQIEKAAGGALTGSEADRRLVNDAAEAKALLEWLRSIGVAR